MPIDASIYSQIQPPQTPDPLRAAQGAMALSNMGMQQAQMQYQMNSRRAMMQAYADNTDPMTGQVDQQGVISTLGKMHMGQLASDTATGFAQQQKAQAEAKSAQDAAVENTLRLTGPTFDYMNYVKQKDPSQMPALWAQKIQDLKAQGVDTSNMDHDYDPQRFDQYVANWQASKPGLEAHQAQVNIAEAQAKTAEAWANAGTGPLKRQTEEFGSRSPVVTATDQYSAEPAVKNARASQVAMKQMIDNYNNRSPQGDASLMLNAFRIKFPNAPDVNSLDELSKSQSVPDQWKQAISHRVNGLFDQGTIDNLMRDGVSTYRANVGGLQDTQQKYQDWAKQTGIPSPNTNEPAVNKTYQDAAALQKKIGPYVPPADRPGIMGSIGNMLGMGSAQSASASSQAPPTQYRAIGSKVSTDQLQQYALKHGKTLKDAQSFLRSQGYVVGN